MKNTKNENLFIIFINTILLIASGLCLNIFIAFVYNINFTRRHPEPRIPPDSRSVQILYRISGMLNESNRSHIGDGTSHALLHWHKWES